MAGTAFEVPNCALSALSRCSGNKPDPDFLNGTWPRPPTPSASLLLANILAALESAGTMIGSSDLLVATTAIHYGHPVPKLNIDEFRHAIDVARYSYPQAACALLSKWLQSLGQRLASRIKCRQNPCPTHALARRFSILLINSGRGAECAARPASSASASFS